MPLQLHHLNPLGDEQSPHRLCDTTRRLAAQYLAGAFRDRLQPVGQLMIEPADEAADLRARGQLARELAQHVPLHILPAEHLAGCAPFIEATWHQVPGLRAPARNADEAPRPVSSISHTTVDFANAVHLGLSGLEADIRQQLAQAVDDTENAFCLALLDTVDAMRLWLQRYRDAYQALIDSPDTTPADRTNCRAVLDCLNRVPENPPQTFAEALQSLWSFFSFQRLNGNWSGLGRLDALLGPYLSQDLAQNRITLDDARELLAHFWIKGTEWCHGLREGSSRTPGTGDAQHYQNIILGGIDANDTPIENDVTHLVLDVIEELHISDLPVAVRLSRQSSDRLLEHIARVQLLGGGIVSVYNEETVMAGLRRLGLPEEDVKNYTNDGCWEAIIPGKTRFSYHPFDALECFQKALFADPVPDSFEALYSRYLTELSERVNTIAYHSLQSVHPLAASGCLDLPHGRDVVLSLLEPCCRRKRRSYHNGGTDYIIHAIHAGGLPDIANSLRAIQEFVFRRHELPLAELVDILRHNWEGHEDLRRHVRQDILYYGNDDPEADAMMRRVHSDFSAIVGLRRRCGDLLMPPGVSTFGREIEFAAHRLATAFGARAGEYLAPNLSPTPGTDRSPLTSVLNSYTAMDLTGTPNGCPLDLRINAALRKLPDAPAMLAAILKVFVQKGGWYLQIDAVDADVLRQAQQDPDCYPNLVVRVSGWSARFATLNKQWQDMIIRRTTLELA